MKQFSRARRWALASVGAAALVATFLVGGSAAQATDWGGDGSPTGCTDGYTVKSATIYGSRGTTKGKPIGHVELRWSWKCHANWSRVVLYGGLYNNLVTVEQRVEAEGRKAGANDSVRPPAAGTTAWSPYLRLRNSQSRACAYATMSSDFGTLNFHTNGASVCA